METSRKRTLFNPNRQQSETWGNFNKMSTWPRTWLQLWCHKSPVFACRRFQYESEGPRMLLLSLEESASGTNLTVRASISSNSQMNWTIGHGCWMRGVFGGCSFPQLPPIPGSRGRQPRVDCASNGGTETQCCCASHGELLPFGFMWPTAT